MLYSLFWGFLGVVWVKFVLPFSDKLMAKLPIKISHFLVWLVIVFFIFDAGLSAAAAIRMDKRAEDIPPSNQLEIYLDEHFPDDRMREIYANSRDV